MLILSVSLFFCLLSTGNAAIQNPDIWGLELPTDGTGQATNSVIFRDKDNNVRIVYLFKKGDYYLRDYDIFNQKIIRTNKITEIKIESKTGLDDLIAFLGRYMKKYAVKTLVDKRSPFSGGGGTHVKVSNNIRLVNAGAVYTRMESRGPIIPCGYDSRIISKFETDSHGKQRISEQTLLIKGYKVPKKPDNLQIKACHSKTALIDKKASTERLLTINLHARAINPVLADLEDGTFLLKDEDRPEIIRFRYDFTTPVSTYIKDIYFISGRTVSHMLSNAIHDFRYRYCDSGRLCNDFEYTIKELADYSQMFDVYIDEYIETTKTKAINIKDK